MSRQGNYAWRQIAPRLTSPAGASCRTRVSSRWLTCALRRPLTPPTTTTPRLPLLPRASAPPSRSLHMHTPRTSKTLIFPCFQQQQQQQQLQKRLFFTSPVAASRRILLSDEVVNRLLEGRKEDISFAQLGRQEGLNRLLIARWVNRLLSPFLENAVEPASAPAASTPTLATTRATVSSSLPSPSPSSSSSSSSSTTNLSAYPLLASAVKRPWTAQERDRLCMLAVNERSWHKIAQALERDVLTCRAKYSQLNRETFGTSLHMRASQKKNPYWQQLRSLGFTPAHRDRLVKALESQRQKQEETRRMMVMHQGAMGNHDDDDETDGRRGGDAGGASGGRDTREDRRSQEGQHRESSVGLSSSLEDLFLDHLGPQGVAAAAMGFLPPGSYATSKVDWEEAAQALDGQFSAGQLEEIYKTLAKARLIWTEEEDARLIQVMIRRGGRGRVEGHSSGTASDELQERAFWVEVRDSFGDPVRTPEDYKNRWRMLDMPLLDREWDTAEKARFWRRFIEFQRLGSLINPRLATASQASSKPGEPKNFVKDPHEAQKRTSGSEEEGGDAQDKLLLNKAALMSDTFMWDTIAEGLDYRHGRDCQAYFERMTHLFPRDPETFGFLVKEVAQKYLHPPRAPWTKEDTELVYNLASKYRDEGKPVKWAKIGEALQFRYTKQQMTSKFYYLLERGRADRTPLIVATASSAVPLSKVGTHPDDAPITAAAAAADDDEKEKGDGDTPTLSSSSSEGSILSSHKQQLEGRQTAQLRWTDKELELLRAGLAKYADDPQRRWRKIQQEFLPHRTRIQIRERYDRLQGHAYGRFTGKEQRLLDEAIEFLGEGASWDEVAQMVPGRTATQCRQAWSYGQSHALGHAAATGPTTAATAAMKMAKEDARWSPQDHERLEAAVGQYGTSKWSTVAEMVVGKTAIECRNEWRLRRNPSASYARWSSEEVDRLMERVSEYLTKQQEAEYEAAMASQQSRPSLDAKSNEELKVGSSAKGDIFVDPQPRYKGKIRIDWPLIAEGMPGRTPSQCYYKFQGQRKTYRMTGDF